MGKSETPRKRNRKPPVLPEGFVTTTQATKELGVSAATLRRWVQEGRVEAMKVGRHLRFRQADLRRMVTIPAPSAPTAAAAGEAHRAPTPADLRICERRLDTILAQHGVTLDQTEQELVRELKSLKPEHDIPAARLLAKLLMVAVRCSTSDLHIEAFEDGAKVRQRVDGLLSEVIELPKAVHSALIAELKRWSNLNVSEKSRPQDGRITILLLGHNLDMRLSIAPAVFGEDAAIRLLDRDVQLPKLDRLGFEVDQLDRWRRIVRQPAGLVLVNGPTGCGKTTVVYASLAELADPTMKIMTAEDPVEYTFAGVSQMAIRPEIGFDFPTAARAMLRHAANVMFIGELRDRATAEIAAQAAITGHLVFSQLHTNDAILAVRRLLEMDVPPVLVSSSLLAVTAQRLVRRICQDCREEYRPDGRALDSLGLPEERRGGKFHRGKGCAKCRNTGYRGRVAVIELLEVNGKVREAVYRGGEGRTLLDAARDAGWRTMREIVLDKISRGETTIEEAVRVSLA